MSLYFSYIHRSIAETNNRGFLWNLVNFARYYDVCLYSRSSVNDSSLKFNWFRAFRGWKGKVKSGKREGKKAGWCTDIFFPSRLRFTGINLLGVKTAREEQLSTLRRRAIFFSSYSTIIIRQNSCLILIRSTTNHHSRKKNFIFQDILFILLRKLIFCIFCIFVIILFKSYDVMWSFLFEYNICIRYLYPIEVTLQNR